MRVFEVEWDDAWVETGDFSVKRAQKCKPIRTTTIGYLVSENEWGITLATDIYEKDKKNVKIINHIGWGMIVDYWEYEDAPLNG